MTRPAESAETCPHCGCCGTHVPSEREPRRCNGAAMDPTHCTGWAVTRPAEQSGAGQGQSGAERCLACRCPLVRLDGEPARIRCVRCDAAGARLRFDDEPTPDQWRAGLDRFAAATDFE